MPPHQSANHVSPTFPEAIVLQHALEAIHEAERHAASIATDGRRRVAEIEDSAARDLKAMEEKTVKERTDRRKSLMSASEASGKAEAARIAEETARRIDTLRTAATASMNTAVAEVLKRLIG